MLNNSKIAKGFLVATLTASLLIPSAVFAYTDDSNEDSVDGNRRPGFAQAREIGRKANKDGENTHDKLLSIVEQYASEDLDEWNEVPFCIREPNP